MICHYNYSNMGICDYYIAITWGNSGEKGNSELIVSSQFQKEMNQSCAPSIHITCLSHSCYYVTADLHII